MSPADAQRWEYRTLRPPRDEAKKEATDPQQALDEAGAAGWELVETVDYTGGGTKFLVFKRPLADAEAGESP